MIVGFGLEDVAVKWLFDYESLKGEPHPIRAGNINPYLVDGKDAVLVKRKSPLCNVPKMVNGSKPTDGGNLLLTDEERIAFIQVEPDAERWIQPFSMGEEFINGINRWCLWLINCPPDILRKMPQVVKRVEAVKKCDLAVKTKPREGMLLSLICPRR